MELFGRAVEPLGMGLSWEKYITGAGFEFIVPPHFQTIFGAVHTF